jgi:hypothetical protein
MEEVPRPASLPASRPLGFAWNLRPPRATMYRVMRRHAFSAFALLSLLAVGLLCIGFLGRIGLTVLQNVPGGAGPSSGFELWLDGGRVACYVTDNPRSPGTMSPGRMVDRYFELFPLRAPDWRQAIWGFDVQLPNHASPAGVRVFLLRLPIWAASVPFLIAPTIWAIKWRRKRIQGRSSVQGFSIVNPQ